MTIKKQFKTLGDNWLLLSIGVVLVLLLFSLSSIGGNSMLSSDGLQGNYGESLAYDSMRSAPSGTSSYYPEIESRIVIKSATMSVTTKTDEYDTADTQLKSFVRSYDGDITSENVNTNGKGLSEYKVGSYTIKVATTMYDSLVSDLRTIGDVSSFNENARDVTENYIDTQDSLELETNKLARYQALYDESNTIKDKLELEDRIFSQERTIAYLEKQLQNTDQKVEYTTVSLRLREEQSSFANISLLKFGDWIRNIVVSLNVLLYLIAWAIPFGIAITIGLFIKRKL